MRRLLTFLGALLLTTAAFAQLSANFETNSTYYTKKPEQTVGETDKDYGTNNYLVVGYATGDFKAGIQVEAYKPALRGYSKNLDGYMLAMKYLTFEKNGFSVTAGDFFEQFGSGLMFRSWEDRELGINNSIEGGRIGYDNRIVSVKGIIGRPRLYMHHESVRIAGGETTVSLADLLHWKKGTLQWEGAYVNRHESPNDVYRAIVSRSSTNFYSSSLNVGYAGWYTRFEYVYKDKDLYYNKEISDYQEKNGNAQLLETGYNAKGLGIALSLRRLERMGTKLTRTKTAPENVFNYVPALTRQYTYSIANLNPYIAQADGEKGGQLDVFGKTTDGWRLHANASTYTSLHGSHLLFADVNGDVERQWNKSWKTLFLYSYQNNKIENRSASHIFVGDVQYKFNTRRALRLVAGYLYSQSYEKDWLSALAELTFAPSWSFYASDLYNSGTTNKHYYSAGVSFSQQHVRLDLSYGRNRAGYVCSGGICRYSPEYTGLNLTANISL
jgi:hypothetical protein